MKNHQTVAISQILMCIKGDSSKWINDNKFTKLHFGWQTGYGAFSVSQSKTEALLRYIDNQEEHHKKQTFKEELIVLLEKHEIKYDERYLWD